MSGILGQVSRGRVATRPIRAVVYGVEGVGKSTFAAGAPEPLFLDAERGTLGLDVARVSIASWRDFQAAIEELRRTKHPYKTIVLDTLDALDRLLVADVCATSGATSIEEVGGGYGKGWTAVEERWGRTLEVLADLQQRTGCNLIALAHANVETFRDPGGADWHRWTLRVGKKSAAIWKGWCEELLFATREVRADKRSKKATGGQRVIYSKWSPAHECKNRRDLPERLPLDWSAFAAAAKAGAERAAITSDGDDHSADDEDGDQRASPKPEREQENAKGPPETSGPPPGVEAEDLREQIEALMPKLAPEKREVVSRATKAAGDDVSRLKSGLAFCRQLVAAAAEKKPA